jgi:hypothetical protein
VPQALLTPGAGPPQLCQHPPQRRVGSLADSVVRGQGVVLHPPQRRVGPLVDLVVRGKGLAVHPVWRRCVQMLECVCVCVCGCSTELSLGFLCATCVCATCVCATCVCAACVCATCVSATCVCATCVCATCVFDMCVSDLRSAAFAAKWVLPQEGCVPFCCDVCSRPLVEEGQAVEVCRYALSVMLWTKRAL